MYTTVLKLPPIVLPKANDGNTDSNTVSVTITVGPVNDALKLPIKFMVAESGTATTLW
jgi:hypothetical protein